MASQTKMKPAHAAAHAAPSHSPRARVRTPRAPLTPWGAGGYIRSGEISHRAAHKARPVRPPWFATVIPYTAVLVLVSSGVYITWHQGSNGGGVGGAIAGTAFLVAAGVRLGLPGQLAGLLASRNRTTDVATLVIFGIGLLVLGLVLPS